MIKASIKTLSLMTGFVFCTGAVAHAETDTKRPNFIFFISDDISQEDHGCYGHPVIQTPHIDRLASEGMRFDEAYLTISSCSPSRCSIITGRYPHNTGAPELHSPLPDNQIRFPELLHQNGYYTVLSGKNHMFGKQDRAFNKITGGGGPGASDDWVEHVRDRPKDQPFFFWFASNDAHRGWQTSEHAPNYKPEDVIVPPYNFDGPITREDLTHYYHEVSRFDHFIGKVVAELEVQGELENTFIVIASDNGRPFPRAKSRLYDSGIKTPWVVYYAPLIANKGAATDSFVSTIDLSATCLELAGLEIPEYIQGQSFTPILANPKNTVREVIFAEQNWHVYRNHSRLVRWKNYAYIRNNFPDQMNLCAESDITYPSGKELWQAQATKESDAFWQTFSNPYPKEELYDLSQDPDQLNNLATSDKHSSAMKTCRELLAKWTEQTGDTIPENPTPNRHDQPRIEDGKVIGWGKGIGGNPHAEFPGAARNADQINHPGPITL